MQIRLSFLRFTSALAVLSSLAIAAPAHAQEATQRMLMNRIDHLEQQINNMQRGGDNDDDTPVTVSAGGGTAQLGVRLSSLEEQMRQLQGQVEQSNYQSRQAQEQITKMQQDVDFRFRDLEQRAQAPVATAPAPVNQAIAPNPAGEPLPAPTAATEPVKAASGPNDQYNQAFRLLNQSKYEESYASFKKFVTDYPKDPLVGNAYYWMGESFYVRRDYTNAADHFRQGFEAMPKGPKAGDNLLKLAMSLSAMNKNSEACIVLRQVVKDYTGKSSAVVSKANNEMSRIGCR